MHARPPFGEEAADGRVLGESRKQLEPVAPDAEIDGLDSLVVEPTAKLDLGAEEAAVRRDRRLEVVDGERHVMHRPHLHAVPMLTVALAPSARARATAS